MCSGASPIVPSTSSWPAWPIEHDRVALGGELLGLDVDLGDQRAGGVDRVQARASAALAWTLGRHAVRREHHRGALGHLGLGLDEHRPAVAQLLDHVLVVDDLLADVDRRAVELERALDRLHGAVDARAVAARRREQQLVGDVSHRPDQCRRPRPRARAAGAQSLAVTASSRSANCARAPPRGGSGCARWARSSAGGLVAAQDLAGDRRAVDLVGAVVDARGAREAVHRLERQVGRVAERAVDLQRAVDDVVQHLGAVELDQRDVLAGRARRPAVSIFQAACSVISRAACISAAESAIQFWTVCLLGQQSSRARSGTARARRACRRRAGPRPSQRMQWWMRPGHEPLLGDQEARRPRRRAARRRGRGRPRRGSRRGRRSAPKLLARVLHRRRRRARCSTPGRVGVDDEHRGALVRPRVGVGDRHHDQEVGDRAVRGEPLVAVDHPLVAVADRARLQQRRVGAGACRARSSRTRLRRSPASSGCSQRSFCSGVPASARISRVARVGRRRCRTRAARSALVPRISCISPSLTWPKPWPPSSGGEVRGPQARAP